MAVRALVRGSHSPRNPGRTWLHTLGNLTLTGYNSQYSNRPFTEKQDITGGFRESPLRLNKGLGTPGTWDEAAITERAQRLVSVAAEVWALPSLTEETLAVYRDKPARPVPAGSYALADHPQLAPGQPMQPIFEALRKELLALDPCVSEDFLKLYITYRAESYFVNVVPLGKHLVLNLNMPFGELRDLEGRARDVTNIGHWGRGDVEVTLSTDDDMPHILGLVRQALDRQLRVSDSEA